MKVRVEGRLWQDGDFWVVHIPLLDVSTQGKSFDDALYMAQDVIESLINKKGFTVQAIQTSDSTFEIESSDYAVFIAFMLKRQREASGLALEAVSNKLGQISRNTYARYEQGRGVPTFKQLGKLLEVVSSKEDEDQDG